jgi:regulator of nucleoside diphosphate kinase
MSAAHEILDHTHSDHFLRRPPIVLTTLDRDNLFTLLRTSLATIDPIVAHFLREELKRADIACGEIPPTAMVTIGSTVKFVDYNATNIRQVKLVLPDEANDVDLISVTAALGSALIGLGPGQTMSWYEGQIERRTTVLETTSDNFAPTSVKGSERKAKGAQPCSDTSSSRRTVLISRKRQRRTESCSPKQSEPV